MGDMTIRGIDEATLTVLKEEAERRGMDPADYAGLLLRQALPSRPVEERLATRIRGDRAAVARDVLGRQREAAKTESVVFIREDRARR